MADRLEQHPLSALFPAMPEADLIELAEDIKKHGQVEPGMMFEGKVLDGWHRYLACERVGIQFSHRDYEGDNPAAFVSSRNLHRRHMTASQRAGCIVACTNWRPNGVRYSSAVIAGLDSSAPGAELTTEEMAERANVSPRTITHAKAAHEKGLGKEVRSGKVSAKRAAEGKVKKPAGKNKPKIHTVSLGKCQATQAEHCDPGDVVVHDDAAQQPKGDDDGQSSAPAPAARRQRRLTRTKRWADACASAEAALQDLMEMQAEFEAWREALPENLSGSAIAEKLDAIGEIDIQAAIDLVEEASGIDLPLGYGRD